MIASLRTWHRRILLTLAVLLPLLLALALSVRQSVPVVNGLPAEAESPEAKP